VRCRECLGGRNEDAVGRPGLCFHRLWKQLDQSERQTDQSPKQIERSQKQMEQERAPGWQRRRCGRGGRGFVNEPETSTRAGVGTNPKPHVECRVWWVAAAWVAGGVPGLASSVTDLFASMTGLVSSVTVLFASVTGLFASPTGRVPGWQRRRCGRGGRGFVNEPETSNRAGVGTNPKPHVGCRVR